MTRAKEKLILLSIVKNIDTNLQKLAAQITEEETVPPYTVSNAPHLEWLMLCALRHPNGMTCRRIEADDDIILRTHCTPWDIRVVYSEPQILSDLPKAEAPAPVDEALRRASKGIFLFVYLTLHRQSLQRRSRPPRLRQNKPKRKPHFHARRF